jgi:hypothetical protein
LFRITNKIIEISRSSGIACSVLRTT